MDLFRLKMQSLLIGVEFMPVLGNMKRDPSL